MYTLLGCSAHLCDLEKKKKSIFVKEPQWIKFHSSEPRFTQCAVYSFVSETVILTSWQKNMTPRVTEGLLVLYLEFMYMNIGRTSLYM